MKYDFTSIMDRKGKDAVALDLIQIPGAEIQEGFSKIPMWVADMNFPTVPTIPEAIIQRAKHPAYGYFFESDADYACDFNAVISSILICCVLSASNAISVLSPRSIIMAKKFLPVRALGAIRTPCAPSWPGEAGHTVQTLHPQKMNIHPCLGCEACHRSGGTCAQKDDMEQVFEAMAVADVLVLATPVYFYDVSAQLKTVIDRTYSKFYTQPMAFHFTEAAFISTCEAAFLTFPRRSTRTTSTASTNPSRTAA